jgi:coenzyme F420 hydrogenase subunit beta
MTLTVEQIVEGGLCIGCGLCRAIAGPDHIQVVMTPEGRERPIVVAPLDDRTLATINAVCPGVLVEGGDPAARSVHAAADVVWGHVERLAIGYAGDPDVRHRASSGGVLTALGQHLLAGGLVKFVVHVSAARSAPMRSERRLSFDAAEVMDGAGSRYGPAAALVDFTSLLDREEPFALIAKPCDRSAVRNLAKLDPRVDRFMRYALAFVCGGASELTKSEEVLEEFGVAENELSLFRYRGHGHPGPTRLETRDGRAFELTYQKMWEVESTWRIQARCKICPDAIGESADVVAFDAWSGGGPQGEADGCNGIMVRTRRGLELYEGALAAGAVKEVPGEVTFRDLDEYQPHQVRKKRAVGARLSGMASAGRPVLTARELRVEECARLNTVAENLAEARGARARALSGRLGEVPATVRDPSLGE